MGNVDHNYQVFADACHPSKFVLSCYGGNTSDNAAKKEGIKTFEATMNSYQFEHSDWCQVYGIDRWAIFHNNPFHCCNLAIQHASEKGLGKTDKGNNRQIHHRQAMQTLHDIVSSDPVLAQIVADEVLAEFSPEYQYKLKTWRERIQRWLVNGRFAKKIMEGVDLLSDETTDNFWVLWGMHYLPLVDNWKRTAVEEIIQFFLMPEIIVGIQFEAELVDYFEVTYCWHSMPGELCKRSGFRTMELHHLLFDHIMPFWEVAIHSAEKRFPKTLALIEEMAKIGDSNVEEDQTKWQNKADLMKDQIKEGINAGTRRSKSYIKLSCGLQWSSLPPSIPRPDQILCVPFSR